MKNALVTGGAGFIGSHLTDHLLRSGWNVRVLDNLSTGTLANVRPQIEFVQGDVRDAETCLQVCRDRDCVFHLAAIASVARSVECPAETHEVTLGGTLNMLTAARTQGVSRFVYSSSAAVYGNAESAPTREDQSLDPRSPYASAKACGEMYCRNFHDLYGLETVILRYFNVFGAGQSARSSYAAVIPLFLDAFQRGTPPTVYGDGQQTRDFVHVANVVNANLRAAEVENVGGQAFNIASGRGSTLCDLLGIIARITGSDLMPRFEPERSGEVRHSRADIHLAQLRLGYKPTVSLEDGLQQMLSGVVCQAQ